MSEAFLVRRDSNRREECELFVRAVYHAEYRAEIVSFPTQMIALADETGAILCAAGLRLNRDGFFSEAYLDAPVEDVLSRLSGSDVVRPDIFEVTTLASVSRGSLVHFIEAIVGFGEARGFEWAFFTLTSRLSKLVGRMNLSPLHLADADPLRVERPDRWGTYYDGEPRVYAVRSPSLARALPPVREAAAHAAHP